MNIVVGKHVVKEPNQEFRILLAWIKSLQKLVVNPNALLFVPQLKRIVQLNKLEYFKGKLFKISQKLHFHLTTIHETTIQEHAYMVCPSTLLLVIKIEYEAKF